MRGVLVGARVLSLRRCRKEHITIRFKRRSTAAEGCTVNIRTSNDRAVDDGRMPNSL